MFFKLKSILLITLFITVSCSDKDPRSKDIKFKQGSRLQKIIDTLPDYSKDIESYLKGGLASSDIDKFWNIHSDIIDIYIEYTPKTKESPRYSASELAKFINKILPNKVDRLDNKTIQSLFRAKKIIIGGENNSITKNELLKLKSRVNSFKLMSKNIKEEIPFLISFLKDPTSLTYTKLKKIVKNLEPEVKEIIQTVKFKDITYSEVKELINIYSGFNNSKANDIVDVIKSASEIFIGHNKAVTDSASIDGFFTLLKLASFTRIGFESWINGKNNSHLVSLIQELTSRVKQGLEARGKVTGQPVVNANEWLEFIKQVNQLIGPPSLDNEKLSSLWQFITSKFLVSKNGDFTLEDLLVLDTGLDNFSRSIKSYNKILKQKVNCSSSSDKLNMNLKSVYFIHCFSSYFSINGKARLKLGQVPKQVLDKPTYLALNFKSFILKPFFKNYTKTTALNKEQLGLFFEDIIKVVEFFTSDTGLIKELESRISFEGDLFTPYSDADNAVSIYEVSSYLSMLLSSYSSSTEIDSYKPCSNELDVCEMKHFDKKRNSALKNFPQFNKYFDGLSEAEKQFYFNKIRAVTQVETAPIDYLQAFMVLHYQEVFFSLYDTNKNQILDYKEVSHSYDIVKGLLYDIIAMIFPQVSEADALGIYSFLVAKGQLANANVGEDVSTVNDSLIYQYWLRFPEKRSSEAERLELISVLEFLGKLF